jgi:hypothetical protein
LLVARFFYRRPRLEKKSTSSDPRAKFAITHRKKEALIRRLTTATENNNNRISDRDSGIAQNSTGNIDHNNDHISDGRSKLPKQRPHYNHDNNIYS